MESTDSYKYTKLAWCRRISSALVWQSPTRIVFLIVDSPLEELAIGESMRLLPQKMPHYITAGEVNRFSEHGIMCIMGRRYHTPAEILRNVLPPGMEKRVFSIELVRLEWTAVVGSELALRSEPVSLEEHVLTIRVSDAVWGRMILKMQARILPRLRKILGAASVDRIRFLKDGKRLWESGLPTYASHRGDDPAKKGPLGPIPPPLIEAARDIQDPELRAMMVETATRYLRARACRRP